MQSILLFGSNKYIHKNLKKIPFCQKYIPVHTPLSRKQLNNISNQKAASLTKSIQRASRHTRNDSGSVNKYRTTPQGGGHPRLGVKIQLVQCGAPPSHLILPFICFCYCICDAQLARKAVFPNSRFSQKKGQPNDAGSKNTSLKMNDHFSFSHSNPLFIRSTDKCQNSLTIINKPW